MLLLAKHYHSIEGRLKMKVRKLMQFLMAVVMCLATTNVQAQDRPAVVQWSNYIGWIEMKLAEDWGILQKHAQAEGLKVVVRQFDYAPTIDNFCSGAADVVAAANTEIFGQIAGLGRKCHVFHMGDFSDGNDGAVAGQDVNIYDASATYTVYWVENSVNEVLFELWRAKEKPTCNFRFENADENAIRDKFIANPRGKIAVLWNPMLLRAAQRAGTKTLATSAEFPGMITDHYVISEIGLKKFPALPKVIAKSVYEVRERIAAAHGRDLQKIYGEMKGYAGANEKEIDAMQKTTHYYLTPDEGAEYMMSSDFIEKAEATRQICAKAGLLGEGRKIEAYGVKYADGSVTGNASNIVVTFDVTTMKELAGEEQ